MSLNLFSRPKLRVLVPKKIDLAGISAKGSVHTLSGTCMGTTWHVRLVAAEPVAELQSAISALLERIENQMSHFRAHSELCRFASVPEGEWQTVSAEFACVLRSALEVARLSDGAFDPTIARVVDAWGFGAGKRFSEEGFVPPPTESSIRHAAGWKNIDIDAHDRIRQPGRIALNLAAIAKGFAVDAVSEFLMQSGYKNHLVEIGGELRGAGVKPDGQPWWVALELPATNCPLPATRIALHGLGVATSGNYRRHYHQGTRLIQHTMDPRTGLPVAHSLSSVTVIHPACMLADAWATALMVLGPKEGLDLAEKMQLSALLQWRDSTGKWVEAASTAWQDLQQ